MNEISSISSTIQSINLDNSAIHNANISNPNTKNTDFGSILQKGLQNLESKIDHANELVRDFTIDDSIPVHQVTIALEEARIAVELAMQVRTRLVEGYREIMNMQL